MPQRSPQALRGDIPIWLRFESSFAHKPQLAQARYPTMCEYGVTTLTTITNILAFGRPTHDVGCAKLVIHIVLPP